MGRGGKRTGAGRPKGMRNRRTKAREVALKRAAKKIAAAIPEAFEGDAHLFLIGIYKDPTHELAIRIDAAKAVLPFEKPRLSPIDAKTRATEDHVPLSERHQAYARAQTVMDDLRAIFGEALAAVDSDVALS